MKMLQMLLLVVTLGFNSFQSLYLDYEKEQHQKEITQQQVCKAKERVEQKRAEVEEYVITSLEYLDEEDRSIDVFNEEEITVNVNKKTKKVKLWMPTIRVWEGEKLTASKGVCYGPSGKETYYNLPMGGVVNIMRNMGYNEERYPYWVREDGVKMLGCWIMVAADLNKHPRGSKIETSLGPAMVCDTGGFASNGSGVAVDIAVSWR